MSSMIDTLIVVQGPGASGSVRVGTGTVRQHAGAPGGILVVGIDPPRYPRHRWFRIRYADGTFSTVNPRYVLEARWRDQPTVRPVEPVPPAAGYIKP